MSVTSQRTIPDPKPARGRLREVWVLGCAFGALCLAAGDLPVVGDAARRLLCGVAVLGLAAGDAALATRRSAWSALGGLVACCLSFVLVRGDAGPGLGVATLLVVLSTAPGTLVGFEVATAGIAYLALRAAEARIDVLWYAMQDVARAASWLASGGAVDGLRFGASAGGFRVAVLGLLVILACTLRAHGRRRRVVVASFVAVALLPSLLGAVSSLAYEGISIPKGTLLSKMPFLSALVAVPIAAVIVTALRRCLGGPMALVFRRRDAGIAGVALIALTAGAAWSPAPEAAGPKPIVVFEQPGALNDFRDADPVAFGFDKIGLYGLFPKVAQAAGHAFEATKERPAERRSNGDAIWCFLLPTTAWSDEDRVAVSEHVRRGGGLLVLSDHTDLFGTIERTDALLSDYGMRLRFDTAMETSPSLTGNLVIRDVGVLDPASSAFDLQILHGASLTVRPPARPLIVGAGMFGDLGNRGNGGKGAFLGNYAVEAARETVGDLVLAAVAEAGDGRVVAFGDTSTFQSVALGRSTRTVVDLLQWLSGGGRSPGIAPVVSGLLGAVLLLLGLLGGRLAPHASALGLVAVAGSLLVPALGRSATSNLAVLERLPARAPFVLDTGHLPQWNREPFGKKSIQGLLFVAQRAGLVPVAGPIATTQSLDRAAVVAIVAAGEPIEGEESERLVRFVEGGGTLLLATGYEERRGLEPLLSHFGVRVAGTPLGAVPILSFAEMRSYRGPSFVEAWPLEFAERDGWQTGYETDGRVVAAWKRLGAGRLVVVADSWFVTDGNLEDERGGKPENVRLLLELLGRGTAPRTNEGPR